MNTRKLIGRVLLIGGCILFVVLILFLINQHYTKCDTGHEFVAETNQCYYFNMTCHDGTNSTRVEKNIFIEGHSACVYTPQGFLNNDIVKYVLIILGVGWVLMLIVFIIIVSKGSKNEGLGFKKEEFVEPKRAKELWKLRKAQRENILTINDVPKDGSFNFYYGTEPFQRGKEWFLKFQCEVMDGKNPGLYTIVTSLSRGEKWILGDGYRELEVGYDTHKIPREMPLYVPEDQRERLLESMYERNPEKALELQEQMTEKQIMSDAPEHQDDIPPEPPQQIILRRPPTRRPMMVRRRMW